eukprot:m.272463 g.272463  ORF g.272463 m.272463 type:complete len:1311 (+) comp40563_c0_seq3:40-3972(+)
MASGGFPLPNQFNFAKPEEWPMWRKRWERYRVATKLNNKGEDIQVSTFIYSMGEKAEEILSSFQLGEDGEKVYTTIMQKFDGYFVKKHNVTYERARFNRRRQLEGETVDEFLTALHSLAEHCQFERQYDDFVRDIFVIGLKDESLTEVLLQDAELTLEKAMTSARAREAARKHKRDLKLLGKGEEAQLKEVSFVRKGKKKGHFKKREKKHEKPESRSQEQVCGRCGHSPAHARGDCPARDAKCNRCKKIGHYADVCRTKMVSEVDTVPRHAEIEQPVQQPREEEKDSFFLGAVDGPSSEVWLIALSVDSHPLEFKIDTGADVTVIPYQFYQEHIKKELTPTDQVLRGPSQHRLSAAGTFEALIAKDSTVIQETVYVVKNLRLPLLGRPAIEKLGILRRVDSLENDCAEIQEKYPRLFTGLGKLKEEYKIAMKDDAIPFALSTSRRVPIPLMPKVKAELERMERLKVITKVDEPTDWCSGMVLHPKPNGSLRICVDLTELNKWVKRERHILPSVEDSLAQLKDARVFSKLDANSGFWQIPLAEESVKLTTFITPYGRYCFNRLPFGITSAPEHFQKRMSRILEGLPGVICMMDDVMIFAATDQEHNDRLHKVLKRLEEAGLTLNEAKCSFGVKSVKFLGQIVGDGGTKPDPEKTSAILKMPAPTDTSGVRRLLGMVNQQAKYLPELAEKSKPLRDLLGSGSRWTWGHPQDKAFEEIKRDLTSAPVLAMYDPERETVLSADASSHGLGGVLRQKQSSGEFKVIAYASASLSDAEKRYAQIEKEALALAWAADKFRMYLLGMEEFTIETDHKPLIPLLGNKDLSDLPPRIQRFKMRLMRYKYKIIHVPGKEMICADALSRQPLPKGENDVEVEKELLQKETVAYCDFIVKSLPASETMLQRIRSLQGEDSVCSKVIEYASSSWPDMKELTGELRNYWHLRQQLNVIDGLLLRGTRIVIPPPLREEILSKLHEGHQGIEKGRQIAKQSVWWPGLSAQIEVTVKNCVTCAKAKGNPREPLIPTPFPAYPWQKVATDLFDWRDHKYLLLIDYYSRYVEIAELPSTVSATVINRMKSIFARHGIPDEVFSDNGPQYSSEIFAKFSERYGFVHTTSSPRYPQANGEAERAVQTVKALLNQSDDPYLALLAYRSTPLSNGYSPAELLMSRKIRSTVPMIPELRKPKIPDIFALQEVEERKRAHSKENYDKRHRVKELPTLQVGDRVWVTDQKVEGTVTMPAKGRPRSYWVKTASDEIRRNRRDLVSIRKRQSTEEDENEEETESDESDDERRYIILRHSDRPRKTKSGRVVRAPKKADV